MIYLNKNAQSMSLNTIVIAALVVLVLVILAAIFMGRMGAFTGELGDCKGECVDGGFSGDCPEGMTQIQGSCSDDRDVCCVDI